MSVKTMAAVIVASLVAGVVLGSFGIAGAGTGTAVTSATCPPGMECGTAASSTDCGDCAESAAAAPAPECGSASMDCAGEGAAAQPAEGACADCQ